MSLLNDVSIVVTPNGYGVKKLHAVVPISGAADMVVTRATNATRVNEDGLIESVFYNVPRIDYTGGGCPHILAEPQRTNLFPYSEDFENSDWTKNAGTTITNNYAISPNGDLSASRYLGAGTSGLGDKFTLSAASYTLSFYVKSNTGQNQFCALLGDSNQSSGNIQVTTDWARISHTFTASGQANKTNGIFRDSSNNDIDILIWGAQLEAGSYATSYIPTSGSAVTRNKDEFTRNNLASLINDAEGVLFVEIAALANDSTNRSFTISDGTNDNRLVLKYDNQSNVIESFNRVSGTQTASLSSTVTDITVFNKIAIKYKLNDYALWLNGVEVATDSSASIFTGLNVLTLESGGSSFYGKIRQLQVYKTALTDNQLIRLTSESYESYSAMATALTYTIQ